MIRIERIWSMPSKTTFRIPPIYQLIQEEVDVSKLWIDPFANGSKIATITNDLNPQFDTNHHMDALEFLRMFDSESIDGVLYDPPYSPRQVRECYDNISGNIKWDGKVSFWSDAKDEIGRILKVGGKVICFGWNSNGCGNNRGFQLDRILIVPHGGMHNDTIVTVETKVRSNEISQMSLF